MTTAEPSTWQNNNLQKQLLNLSALRCRYTSFLEAVSLRQQLTIYHLDSGCSLSRG